MKISKVRAHRLVNIPIEPPPFRPVPNTADAVLVEVVTDEGISGWGRTGYVHDIVASFINEYMGPEILGQDPLATEAIRAQLRAKFPERRLGALLTGSLSAIDIALWDIKGKAFGLPVHRLLGGARDRVPVYITHGAAYGSDPRYTTQELVDEAVELVRLGHRFLKNVVGRQAVPDPDDDYQRMKAVREAVGPDISLAMDGNIRMTYPQTLRLCKLTEELDIAYLEEPLYRNNPNLLAQLRTQTTIPIAAAQSPWSSARQLLLSNSVDILQPNVCNDEGYSGALAISELAAAFDVPIGHGNGSGGHNIAFQAGVRNGTVVEYHYHVWMAYKATYKNMPQPDNGYLIVSQVPGLDLDPKDGLIEEYGAAR